MLGSSCIRSIWLAWRSATSSSTPGPRSRGSLRRSRPASASGRPSSARFGWQTDGRSTDPSERPSSSARDFVGRRGSCSLDPETAPFSDSTPWRDWVWRSTRVRGPSARPTRSSRSRRPRVFRGFPPAQFAESAPLPGPSPAHRSHLRGFVRLGGSPSSARSCRSRVRDPSACRYHFDDRVRKAIPSVAVASSRGTKMANPLMAILAVALVTSMGAGVALHAAGTPNPANAANGEACGHEFNDGQGHNWTWTHDEAGEHDATTNHTNNAVCDRESGEVRGHNETTDDDLNETEDEASL